MKRLLSVIEVLPFVFFIVFNIVSGKSDYDPSQMKQMAIIGALIIFGVFVLEMMRKNLRYFTVSLLSYIVYWNGVLFLFPEFSLWMGEHILAGMYFSLFCAAFFPPLFKKDPFTYYFAKKNFPPAVWKTSQFIKINLVINHMWSGIFGFLTILFLLPLPLNLELGRLIFSFFILLGVGLPLTKKLPDLLQNKFKDLPAQKFESLKEMFEAMPYGLNSEAVKDVNIVIQFLIQGDEEIEGYLTIKDQQASFTYGTYKSPTLTIKSDATIWLGISNGTIDSIKAYLNQEFTAEGDMSILNHLKSYFGNEKSAKPSQTLEPSVRVSNFNYGELEPKTIKKAVVFDSGMRGEAFSKSTMMTRSFVKGLESAGVKVDYVFLKDYDINHCTGCYHCFTKGQGECVFKDDMKMLLEKRINADLLLFTSPLFVFSVNGLMKDFMDRSLCLVEPYMIENEGLISHPTRFKSKNEQGMVVFSAGGFPEVAGNFDSLSLTFKNWSRHKKGTEMLGEFYLPCAEMITQPIYADRKKRVLKALEEAGRKLVESGKIEKEVMDDVANHNISKKDFKHQANLFWETMDGKKTFFEGAPQVEV